MGWYNVYKRDRTRMDADLADLSGFFLLVLVVSRLYDFMSRPEIRLQLKEELNTVYQSED